MGTDAVVDNFRVVGPLSLEDSLSVAGRRLWCEVSFNSILTRSMDEAARLGVANPEHLGRMRERWLKGSSNPTSAWMAGLRGKLRNVHSIDQTEPTGIDDIRALLVASSSASVCRLLAPEHLQRGNFG